ncbi:hypothetical protein KIN20_020066 [Parelaphostrongylus tenuis]|uniref:Uncharacterized protein n=1 Tax=Parelaphostrongylus tenuis TaxID=148309 RepID=A0AAD5QTB2_PARTN|nr:hypothetical protein KIN20_020066 [Parelaphostrongylus tenuis]
MTVTVRYTIHVCSIAVEYMSDAALRNCDGQLDCTPANRNESVFALLFLDIPVHS